MPNDNSQRTIFAGRRRRPDAPSGGRERAETPWRRGSSTSSGSRLSLPGCGGRFGCGGTILAIILVLIVVSLQYCGGSFDIGSLFSDIGSLLPDLNTTDITSSGQIGTMPAAAPFATYYPQVTSQTVIPTATAGGSKWLVMLYQDADDSVLEKDICLDLNEAEKAGSSAQVTVVSQLDRYAGAYTGDGNWTTTKRFLITQDNNLDKLSSQEISNLGEANMASGKTLVDFATWAIKTYPADRYALILSDHGMGWPGGWSDATPKGSVDSSIPLQVSLGDELFLNELDDALGQIRAQTGLDKFELIGMDACLMGQLEVFTTLAAHARYAVASEEVEPALGWAYTSFIQALNQNPSMDGAALGRAIVKSYIEEDQKVLDSSVRGDFLSQGSPFGGLFGSSDGISSQQLALELGQESTLTAVDLSKIGALNSSLNKLAFLFQSIKQQGLASSRTYAQSFTNIFGSDVPPSYIDLGNFLQIVKQQVNNTAISQAADAVLAAIKQAVVAEKHGAKVPGATGIAIYFPNSELYGHRTTGAESYTAIANRFAVASLWDDFLAYHYSGRKFVESDAKPVVPSSGSIRAPAAGGITISQVTASSSTAAPGKPIILSANISGENIGHIYLFAGYYDQQANSIFVADRDYLESDLTRQVNGVYYPDWGQGAFTLKFEWEPVVFAINDGNTRVTALFKPHDFGRTFEEAVYTVDGMYTFADGGQQYYSRLYFINGLMRQAYVFSGEADASAPREVIPVAGDKFTALETWLDLDSSGKVIETVSQEGSTLTFGNEMFTWETLDAAAGDYVVGFVVEDLDGNQQQSLIRVTVK
jgi:hypothetical protein